MRTQTSLLLALARGTELLILDEPTEGLDPVVTEKVLELVVGAAADGTTVFFSSHQIAEVEQIADRTVPMGLHHKLCHILGGSFDLPHAETHAVMLPFTSAYNRDAASAGDRHARREHRSRGRSRRRATVSQPAAINP